MKILVGYDGSQPSREALKLAQVYAGICGVKLEIAKSVTRQKPLPHSEIEVAEYILEEEIRNILNGKNIRYETHFLISEKSTGENLVRFAEVIKAEGIYIGARKRSKAGKLLTGSTTQHVVLNAPCPVVTVK
jgi:nucleotide-binding universal stress UspA family protein